MKNDCPCHCHNSHEGMSPSNPNAEDYCKCVPRCEHCWPIGSGVQIEAHTHYWEFQRTQWQYPVGLNGTAAPTEYAFLLCRGCGEVKKTKVTDAS